VNSWLAQKLRKKGNAESGHKDNPAQPPVTHAAPDLNSLLN
jgi:hypothetical protein